ncbi:hypothetical protein L211DRAFT_380380 [Terfezia boudieri ATCC MYA-4762]|uniref:Uncharacterized protein n=1 Tax=Terfezia boudieri ATCC MYA-4762 TaxID=1051890 RepID=A0A3N4M3C7_9PEZI|nr:hypothetical protein L211DRAFT_380380 [Terfezia boudieri ATCC MYA-4762]
MQPKTCLFLPNQTNFCQLKVSFWHSHLAGEVQCIFRTGIGTIIIRAEADWRNLHGRGWLEGTCTLHTLPSYYEGYGLSYATREADARHRQITGTGTFL